MRAQRFIRHIRGEWQWCALAADVGLRVARAQHLHHLFDGFHRAVQVEHRRAIMLGGDRLNERGRGLGRIYEADRAGEGNHEALAQHRREHRHGRGGTHALVARGPINHARANAHARHPPVLPIDPRGLLVIHLARAVNRLQPRVVAHRACRHRTGVGDSLDLAAPRGFENVDATERVDPGAEHRVGLAKRHLQRRQMDDRRGLVAGKHLEHTVKIRHIADFPFHRLGIQRRIE